MGYTLAHSRRIVAAKAFVASVNARTLCEDCGAQPIEWHNPEHEENHNRRIGPMMSRGESIDAIRAEMEASTPLCRRCHMRRDGRLSALAETTPPQQPAKPCSECGTPAKPLRRGLCKRCYQRTPAMRAYGRDWKRRQRAKDPSKR